VVPGLFVAALFAVYFLRQSSRSSALDEWVIEGPTMGTAYAVKVVTHGDQPAEARERLEQGIREAVDAVDDTMSTYRSESEIEIFNRHGSELFEASPEMITVVAEAQRVSRLSGGAFDITVGPLVDLWGFGPAGPTEAPTESQIGEMVALTGYQHLQIDADRGLLRKARPDCRIDLSAIAKGFAVDRVAAVLDREGYASYMVEIGGEVRARGRNRGGEIWRIGIEQPDAGGRTVRVAIPLADLSLATSGDYRNFVIRDGIRISHTIDPRTGRPISHLLASVSVINASCMTADALATALDVLGPDEGFALAESHDIPALFLVRVGDGVFEERRTTVWTALVENIRAPAPVSQGE
jgi:thiamine biosynthesis lipoprotein